MGRGEESCDFHCLRGTEVDAPLLDDLVAEGQMQSSRQWDREQAGCESQVIHPRVHQAFGRRTVDGRARTSLGDTWPTP